MHIEVESNLNS